MLLSALALHSYFSRNVKIVGRTDETSTRDFASEFLMPLLDFLLQRLVEYKMVSYIC